MQNPATTRTRTPLVLIASVSDRRSAEVAAKDYFADYALNSEQESIGRMMRHNRAPFIR